MVPLEPNGGASGSAATWADIKTLEVDNLQNLLSLRAEMQEDIDKHENQMKRMEKALSKQTRLLAEVTTLAKVTPALEARITYIENEVPTLEVRVDTMEPTVARVPVLEQSVSTVCNQLGDLIQTLQRGGRGPGGGGVRPRSEPCR